MRIAQRFAELKAANRAGFVAFVTAGDPNLETSLEILKGLPKAGADVIELGMPFTDPMAEGPAPRVEHDLSAGVGGHGAEPAQRLRLVQLDAHAPRRLDDAREVLGRLARRGHRPQSSPGGRAGLVDTPDVPSLESPSFPPVTSPCLAWAAAGD